MLLRFTAILQHAHKPCANCLLQSAHAILTYSSLAFTDEHTHVHTLEAVMTACRADSSHCAVDHKDCFRLFCCQFANSHHMPAFRGRTAIHLTHCLRAHAAVLSVLGVLASLHRQAWANSRLYAPAQISRPLMKAGLACMPDSVLCIIVSVKVASVYLPHMMQLRITNSS